MDLLEISMYMENGFKWFDQDLKCLQNTYSDWQVVVDFFNKE